MVVGVSLTIYYIMRLEFDGVTWLGIHGLKMEPWFQIQSTSAGVFGIIGGFATIILVSLITKPYPGAASFLDGIRHGNDGSER
jgi:cation/acetate symporter